MIVAAHSLRVNSDAARQPSNVGDGNVDFGSRPFDHLAKALFSTKRIQQNCGEDVVVLTADERAALVTAFRLQTGQPVGFPTISFSLGRYWVSNEHCRYSKRAYLTRPTPEVLGVAGRSSVKPAKGGAA